MELRDGFTLRVALIGDLFLFVIALMMFSILPVFGDLALNPVTPIEVISFLLGVPALVLLAGRMLVRPYIRGNRWAYLYTCFYAILVGSFFITFAVDIASPPVRATLLVVLFSHIVGSFGAHVIEGSDRPLTALLEKENGNGSHV